MLSVYLADTTDCPQRMASESRNSLATGRCAINVKVSFPNTCHGLRLRAFIMNLLSSEFNRPCLMTSYSLSSQKLSAVRQQAITWVNIDPELCHPMASEGHNKLKGGKMLRGSIYPVPVVLFQTYSWDEISFVTIMIIFPYLKFSHYFVLRINF